ncbi:alpha/beta fold hydrolase [Streptomyces aurantiacus]|uniref:Putative 3-oxoadipate enol-lactonase 2 n=1 Tax=Streptomyces aurantiacus JA 4570 TaxID=1286094 RepID=S4AFW4_9ACTN|nr:alpha/beta fold hydrolase [Streptomyces aurantiacus]EPH40377.1 putative 3-oxoadipate enol-lactonase 2 [Streptomyces aurantiacus JA 4570]
MPTARLSNGVHLSYDDHPGPDNTLDLPLVLVHGHPFDRSLWDPQVAAFAGAHRVITFDLRGYGESTARSAPQVADFGDFARDLEALLDHLKIERCALGGVSMGGQIVMDAYARFPDRIAGLLLADTSPAVDTEAGKAFRRETADRLMAEGMKGYADEVLHKMAAPYNPEAAAHVHRMMLAAQPQGAAAALRARAERPDYRPVLPKVTVPSLVIVGRDDTYTPVADAEAMHAALPDSTLSVIERAAHLPNLERPEEFNAAVSAWLARIP